MKKHITRRELFRYSATAGVGAFLVPDVFASANQSPNKKQEFKIPERVLGRTGMKLPVLSFGVNRSDNPNVLRAAYNSGIFHFDTGYAYQNGNSEIMMGNVLGDKPRETLNIATKAMFDYPLKDNFEEQLFEHLDTSLKRMKIDYVDIFYAHSISSVEKLTDPKVLAALMKIKESGKAKALGFSSHDQDNSLLLAAIDTGVYDVAMITYNFKVKNKKETDEAIEKAVKAGIGIVAMKVMVGGTEDSEGKKKIDGRPCLRWIWDNENITTVVPSIANYDELDNCLESVKEIQLTSSDIRYLDSLREKTSLLCNQCGECKNQCPQQLPIPDIMRAYMYAYGYKNAKLSKETLLQAGISTDICSDCKECKVRCSSGFVVNEKIAAIKQVITIPDVFLT